MRNYIELNGKSSLEIQGLIIQELPPISKPKIRTNIELAPFIYTLMNLNRPVPEDITFNNVDILYANNVEEAKLLIYNYRKKDYKLRPVKALNKSLSRNLLHELP